MEGSRGANGTGILPHARRYEDIAIMYDGRVPGLCYFALLPPPVPQQIEILMLRPQEGLQLLYVNLDCLARIGVLIECPGSNFVPIDPHCMDLLVCSMNLSPCSISRGSSRFHKPEGACYDYQLAW